MLSKEEWDKEKKEWGVMSPADLKQRVAEIEEKTLRRREWGPWRLETGNFTLTYLPKKHGGQGREYEIDLDRIYDSARYVGLDNANRQQDLDGRHDFGMADFGVLRHL